MEQGRLLEDTFEAESSALDEVQLDDVQILTINGKKFATGLRWESLTQSLDFMKEARELGKQANMDVVVIREGMVLQGGFVAKKSGATKGMYSAAAALVDIFSESWVGVFDLHDGRYYLIAAEKKGVVPGSDLVGSKDVIYERLLGLNAYFDWTEENIIAPADWNFGGREEDLSSILTADVLDKSHKLRQLTFGLSGKEWVRYGSVIGAVAVLAGAGLFYKHSVDSKQAAIKLEQARLNLAEMARLNDEQRKLMESSSLTRPWTLTANHEVFASVCEKAIFSLPLSVGGWAFEKANCQAGEVIAKYKRGTGATNLLFLNELHAVLGPSVRYMIAEDDGAASFTLPHSMAAGGDDMPSLKGGMRHIFASHFQRSDHQIKIDPAVSRALIPSMLPNGAPWPKDAPAPVPTWLTYSFSFNSASKPSLVLEGMPLVGVRLFSMEASLNASSELSWKSSGEIYGK